MAKQIVATMRILHDGEEYVANKPVDPNKFTKDQLTRLYERGAIRVEDASAVSEPTPSLEDVTGENK